MAQMGVYFLLDTSASMNGRPLQVLYEAYDFIVRHLARFNGTHQLTFSVACYESQLYEICHNQPAPPILPPISPAGASRLGDALNHAGMWLKTDSTRQQHALIILIADDLGNDNWSSRCQILDQFDGQMTLIAIAYEQQTRLHELCHVAKVFSLKQPDILETWLKQFMGRRH